MDIQTQAQTPKTRGRPRKPPEDRTQCCTFSATPGLLAILDQRATRANVTRSGYIVNLIKADAAKAD